MNKTQQQSVLRQMFQLLIEIQGKSVDMYSLLCSHKSVSKGDFHTLKNQCDSLLGLAEKLM